MVSRIDLPLLAPASRLSTWCPSWLTPTQDNRLIASRVCNFALQYNVMAATAVALLLRYSGRPQYSTEEPDWAKQVLPAAVYVGVVVGGVVFGFAGDVFGRRSVLLLALSLATVGTTGCATMFGDSSTVIFSWYSAFRFLTGLGVGGMYPLSAVLSAEAEIENADELRGDILRRTITKRVGMAYLLQPPGALAPFLLAVILLKAMPIHVSAGNVTLNGLLLNSGEYEPTLDSRIHHHQLNSNERRRNQSQMQSSISDPVWQISDTTIPAPSPDMGSNKGLLMARIILGLGTLPLLLALFFTLRTPIDHRRRRRAGTAGFCSRFCRLFFSSSEGQPTEEGPEAVTDGIDDYENDDLESDTSSVGGGIDHSMDPDVPYQSPAANKSDGSEEGPSSPENADGDGIDVEYEDEEHAPASSNAVLGFRRSASQGQFIQSVLTRAYDECSDEEESEGNGSPTVDAKVKDEKRYQYNRNAFRAPSALAPSRLSATWQSAPAFTQAGTRASAGGDSAAPQRYGGTTTKRNGELLANWSLSQTSAAGLSSTSHSRSAMHLQRGESSNLALPSYWVRRRIASGRTDSRTTSSTLADYDDIELYDLLNGAQIRVSLGWARQQEEWPVLRKALVGCALTWALYDLACYGMLAVVFPAILRQGTYPFQSHDTLLGRMGGLTMFAVPPLVGAAVGVWTCTRFGCWWTALTGFVAMAVCFTALGGLIAFHDVHTGDNRDYAEFAMVALLTLVMAAGPGMTTYASPVLMFPAKVRSTFHGMSVAAAKVGTLTGLLMYPPIGNAAHASTVPFIETGFCLLGVVAVVGLLPTTDREIRDHRREAFVTDGGNREDLEGESYHADLFNALNIQTPAHSTAGTPRDTPRPGQQPSPKRQSKGKVLKQRLERQPI